MKKIIIHGIKNCNSMKKAFDFCKSNHIEYDFFDFKKEKPSIELLTNITQILPIQNLINTKGTTYKKLKAQDIQEITLDIIMQNPSIIKRPLILIYDENHHIEKILVGLENLESLL